MSYTTASLNGPHESKYSSRYDRQSTPPGRQPLELIQRLQDAFAAKSIQAPEEHQIKLPLAGIFEHPLELRSITVFAGSAIEIFMHDR